MHIIYFHGFNSAGKKSKKYRILKEAFCQKIHTPTLDYTSDTLFADTEEYIDSFEGDKLIIGTSMGGFMATHFARLGKCEAWVFNPAMYPDESLKVYLGEIRNYVTNETYEWGLRNIKIFTKAIKDVTYELERSDIKVCVGTQDTVIDPSRISEYFKKENIPVIPYEDDHRFSNKFESAINHLKKNYFTP